MSICENDSGHLSIWGRRCISTMRRRIVSKISVVGVGVTKVLME